MGAAMRQGGQLPARLACASSNPDRTVMVNRAGSLFLILVGGPQPIPFLPLTIQDSTLWLLNWLKWGEAAGAHWLSGSKWKDLVCLYVGGQEAIFASGYPKNMSPASTPSEGVQSIEQHCLFTYFFLLTILIYILLLLVI